MNETTTEEWRPVPDWPWYEVSNVGRVRSVNLPRRAARYNGRVRIPYVCASGHLRIALRASDKPEKSWAVHQLVLRAFVGPPPTERHEVAHWDGDPGNNNLANLRWATPSENQMDRVRHGTSNRGERQHMAKLKRDQIPVIRSLLDAGVTQDEIAQQFGVSRGTILAINIRKSWFWVEGAP